MQNTINIEAKSTWSDMQQSAHATSLSTDYLNLISALNDGWVISESAHLLAHGSNDEGQGYRLMLAHPQRLLVSHIVVRKSVQVDALLETEQVPMA